MDEPKKLETLLKTIGKDLTVLDIAKDISNGVTQLTFGQKPLPPLEPVRAESPAVCHEFHDIEGFIEYLTQYGVSDADVVQASVKYECISATLDEKGVYGREQITFRPQVHPVLQPCLAILNKRVPV